jgi:hypothetical protein
MYEEVSEMQKIVHVSVSDVDVEVAQDGPAVTVRTPIIDERLTPSEAKKIGKALRRAAKAAKQFND